MNLSRYNCLLFIIYLFLCAYNFVFYSTYKDDQCITPVAVARLLIFKSNFLDNKFKNQTIPIETPSIRGLVDLNTTITNTTQTIENILSSIQLTTVPLGIAIIYLILSILSLIAFFAIRWFSQMLPEKFSSLGVCKGAVGCFIRNNPKFSRFAHYILMILIVVQFTLIFGSDACIYAKHISGTSAVTGEMWDEAIIYNIVTLCFWGAMFIGFPFIKQILPQEAFIFEPYDGDLGIFRYILCSFVGPN